MKPALFRYLAAETLDAAVTALGEYGDEAVVLAGGQSLLPLLNLRLARPSVVIDINRVSGLSAVTAAEAAVTLGATVRARSVERDPTLTSVLPLFQDATRHIGHPQIRNRTTIGGNIAHADPASELPAVLLALEAEVTLCSSRGTRSVPAHEFFEGAYVTTRRPDELLTGIRVPVVDGLRGAFREVARRHGDYALVGTCVAVRADGDGRITDARIALAGVAATPVRVGAAEELLRGRTPTPETLHAVRDAVSRSIEPRGDLHASAEYRRDVAGVLVRRALTELTEPSEPTSQGRAA